MKKYFILITLLIGLVSITFCQTVDSIKVEQAGAFIKVRYKILNSNANQVFRVTVLCSINGGLQSVLTSLSGDFGDNVVGGRAEYMVLWDVLKDVDEVKSVDFSVKAELIKDLSVKSNSEGKALSDRKFYVFFVGGGSGPKYGGKIGYMGSWGITAMYVMGKIEDPSNDFGSTEVSAFASNLNLSKRIVNANNFNLHLNIGIAVAKFPQRNYESMVITTEDLSIGGGAGISFSIKRLAFSIDFNSFPVGQKYGEIEGDNTFLYIGLGYRF